MKRRVEVTWAVTRVHHERNRYIFNMYYKDKKISKELYDYLVKEGYADANLIAKWRKVCPLPQTTSSFPLLCSLSSHCALRMGLLSSPTFFLICFFFLFFPVICSKAMRDCVVFNALRRAAVTMEPPASAVFPKTVFLKAKLLNVSTVAATAVLPATENSKLDSSYASRIHHALHCTALIMEHCTASTE